MDTYLAELFPSRPQDCRRCNTLAWIKLSPGIEGELSPLIEINRNPEELVAHRHVERRILPWQSL